MIPRRLIFIVALVVLLSSCSTALTDGLDCTVELAEPAQRIVSLTPATTEILFAIGAGDQMVGRDMFSDYPAEVQDI